MKTQHAKRILKSTLSHLAITDDEQYLIKSDIEEIFSIANGLVSEAHGLSADLEVLDTNDDWILTAFSLSGHDEKFNQAFEKFCRIKSQDVSATYAYACRFFYRSVLNGLNDSRSLQSYREIMNKIVAPEVLEWVVHKLNESNLLPEADQFGAV